MGDANSVVGKKDLQHWSRKAVLTKMLFKRDGGNGQSPLGRNISKDQEMRNNTASVRGHSGFMVLESKIWDKKWSEG